MSEHNPNTPTDEDRELLVEIVKLARANNRKALKAWRCYSTWLKAETKEAKRSARRSFRRISQEALRQSHNAS